MRIFAYACRHPEPPLRRGLLPLTELTVLLGPNDTGKSSWLRAIERDLRGGHYAEVPPERAKDTGAVFYAELAEGEMAHLLDESVAARAQQAATGQRRWTEDRPPWDAGLWAFTSKAATELSLLTPPELREAVCQELLEGHPERALIVAELQSSSLVAFEPAGRSPDGTPVFNTYWCLQPADRIESDILDALQSSSLHFFAEDRAREAGERLYSRGLTGFCAAEYGAPEHLRIAGSPIPVVSLGQVERFPMPSGLAVPTTFGRISGALVEAVSRLSDTARYGYADAQREEALTTDELARRQPPGGWLEAHRGGHRIHPDVAAACHFVRRAANRLLPEFLSTQYDLVVEPYPVETWFTQGPLDIRLRPQGTAGSSDFAVAAVADGYRLWLQLALLEAAEQTERARGLLVELAGNWWGQTQAANDATGMGEEAAPGMWDLATQYQERFEKVVESLRRLARRKWVTGELASRLALRPGDDLMTRVAQDRRMLLVDEPERHLHPRLQREAARWLSETADERSAPLILATHGTAFLSLPATQPGLGYLFCSRPNADSTVRRLGLDELQSLDNAVAEMGFDRGELLSTIALFLVVEGRHDDEVLSRAFRAELADNHIALVPMSGASQYTAVLDSQALFRYTTAKVAVMTDKFTPARFKLLMGDDEELRQLRKSDAPEETKALASLMGNAKHQGKTVHLLGHAGSDLIDVIDEDVVIALFPAYPGHKSARRRWQRARRRDGLPAGRKKLFYEQKFKLPNNVTTYQELGDALASRGRKPPMLANVVARAVALAGGE